MDAYVCFRGLAVGCAVVSLHFARAAEIYYDASVGIGRADRSRAGRVRVEGKTRDWSQYDFAVFDFLNMSYASQHDSLWIKLSPAKGCGAEHSTNCHYPEAFSFNRFWMPLRDLRVPKDFGRTNVVDLSICRQGVCDTNRFQLGRVTLVKYGETPTPYPWPESLKSRAAATNAAFAAASENRRREALGRFRAACRAAGQSGPRLVGRATAMEQVRPRGAFSAEPASCFDVRLARNEYESFQALVLSERDERDVSVAVTDLEFRRPWWKRLMPGPVFSATNVTVSVMGYVESKNFTPNKVMSVDGALGYAEKGWYPDVILDFQRSCDVAAEDVQSFWVRVKCPADQPAGFYDGALKVSFDGETKSFPLTVRVNDFTLPETAPLPMAITFSPGPSSTQTYGDPAAESRLRKLRADSKGMFKEVRRNIVDWALFLSDYRISLDNLYFTNTNIAWDALSELDRRGRLGPFNLGTWGENPLWQPGNLSIIRANYNEAKRRGILDHAYIYGFDEAPKKRFASISNAMDIIKREFPDVPFLTTAFDADLGIGSPLGKIDWFTPSITTNTYAAASVARCRASGHKVWWYTCCFPHAPYPGFFVEAPPIEQRLIMGAMAAKFRPEGFLYYQISIWNANHPIQRGPYTDWNPRTYYSYHGDGSLTRVGPGARPLASVMLENFRDGLEDLWYAKLLEAKGEAVEVPDDLVRTTCDFSRDAKSLAAWRSRMADELERMK